MFMTSYITTLGNVIAVPEGWFARTENPVACLATIRHELQHVRQCRAIGLGSVWLGFPLYAILYLLIPLPFGLAYFRYLFERSAYLESITTFDQHGASLAQIEILTEFAVQQLTTGLYGWTWPFPRQVREYYRRNLETGFSMKS